VSGNTPARGKTTFVFPGCRDSVRRGGHATHTRRSAVYCDATSEDHYLCRCL